MKRSIAQAVTGVALFGAIAVATLQSTPSQAADTTHHNWHRNVNQRQTYQHRRIERGEHTGALTHHESETLEQREARIRRAEARDRRSGGKFTAKERRKIEHRQNRTSRAIYHQKHDQQTRQHHYYRHHS